ncbi:hypothetical protein AB205_0059680 [Aquarana catesbeiana]|uniref:Uncharacterized protein n=1 Tax=Aquarana catesbeiana TaxID=8400 RepID=A0A2G9S506_AQUCT|nr:hypothetical protein AB205_0059680 [Aquarana catesbeiana]
MLSVYLSVCIEFSYKVLFNGICRSVNSECFHVNSACMQGWFETLVSYSQLF